MTTLTSQTTFNIIAAAEVYTEEVDIYISPENTGTGALRELHYPGDLFPIIVYTDNPDKITNFDSSPMTARPRVASEQTLSWAQINVWKGYLPDRSVTESWLGAENKSRMTLAFLRRLYEYYANPPQTPGQYITWWPKDRTTVGYNIVIESLQVGGSDMTAFLFSAHINELVVNQVDLVFKIVSEVSV